MAEDFPLIDPEELRKLPLWYRPQVSLPGQEQQQPTRPAGPEVVLPGNPPPSRASNALAIEPPAGRMASAPSFSLSGHHRGSAPAPEVTLPDLNASSLPPQPGGPGAPPVFLPSSPSVQPAPPRDRMAEFRNAVDNPPQLHGVKKGLDVLGQVFLPQLEQAIPGTPGYQQTRVLPRLAQAAGLERQQEADADARQQRNFAMREKPSVERPDSLTSQEAQAVEELVVQGVPRLEAIGKVKAAGQKPTPDKPDTEAEEAQRFERIDAARRLGQPVSKEDAAWQAAYRNRKTIGTQAQGPERLNARADRSYQFHAGRIDALGKPVQERAARIAGLEDTLNQGTPQADALVAPELLTVMAGGQGSGLRMNEAEIARIVGGRTQWESLRARLDAWQLDPSKGFAITPPQRQQIRDLFAAIQQRVMRKMEAIDTAHQRLGESDDPQEHRRIYSELQRQLSAIDTGKPTGKTKGALNPQSGRYE